MRTIEQYLPEHPFFAGLDDVGDRPARRVRARTCTSGAGEYLFREGEPADRFYVVRHGRVALEVHDPARRRWSLDTVDDGDVVGWSWLVPPYRWIFDARAVEPTSAVAFDGACLRGKCDEDPALGLRADAAGRAGDVRSGCSPPRVRLLDLYGTGS